MYTFVINACNNKAMIHAPKTATPDIHRVLMEFTSSILCVSYISSTTLLIRVHRDGWSWPMMTMTWGVVYFLGSIYQTIPVPLHSVLYLMV
jgi:hypothetical protein